MNFFLTFAALILMINLAAGIVRIMRGPTRTDRMMVAQLFGTTGVAALLLLNYGLNEASLYKMALVFALLSGLAVIAFVKR